MARYIKANPKVAIFLCVENERNTVKDGNYLLWQADMLKFGPLTQLNETLVKIGGIALMAHEAREEQDGTVTRPLPVATDPRFIMDTEQGTAPAEDQPNNGETVAEGEQSEAATGGKSEEITAGDVGNVEDIVDFAPEEEAE